MTDMKEKATATDMDLGDLGTFNVFDDVIYARISPLDLGYIEKVIKADLEKAHDIDYISKYIDTYEYFKEVMESYHMRRKK